jgi:glucose/arabinose dehydrogenase
MPPIIVCPAGRPADVQFLPSGHMLVSDDTSNSTFLVKYVGAAMGKRKAS